MVKWSFVLRIKFSAGRQFSASKSPTSCSCKTLWARRWISLRLTWTTKQLQFSFTSHFGWKKINWTTSKFLKLRRQFFHGWHSFLRRRWIKRSFYSWVGRSVWPCFIRSTSTGFYYQVFVWRQRFAFKVTVDRNRPAHNKMHIAWRGDVLCCSFCFLISSRQGGELNLSKPATTICTNVGGHYNRHDRHSVK